MAERFDIQEQGLAGIIYETGTTVLTGLDVAKIKCLTATVFATLTNTLATGDSLATVALPAGTVLVGRFTAVTLTSGAIEMTKSATLS